MGVSPLREQLPAAGREGFYVMLKPAPPSPFRFPHVQLFTCALPALLTVATLVQAAASSLRVFAFLFYLRCQHFERFCWKRETWRFWGQ